MKSRCDVIMVKFQFYRYQVQFLFLRLSLKLFEMIALISSVCTLTQTRMGEGEATFPSMGSGISCL